MQILFKPKIPLDRLERIKYSFTDSTIRATLSDGSSDMFDFTDFPDGELVIRDNESGEDLLDTSLSINPIWSVKKEDDILYVELLNYIGLDASQTERFPDWIDHTEYITPKVGEADGTDEMEE